MPWPRRLKYSSLVVTYYFVPVAVETLQSALGDEATQFISDLSRRIAATTAEPRCIWPSSCSALVSPYSGATPLW